MKKIIWGVLGIIVLMTAGWLMFSERLLVHIGKSQAQRNMTSKVLTSLPDGLHLVLCGAGAPLPDPTRAGPCVMVLAGQDLYVVDVGSGSPRNFGPMGISPGRVEAVFLTHFHSDHFDGLGELMTTRWASGAHKSPLTVYGPEGVEQLTRGLNLAYAQDFRYRILHHGESVVPESGKGVRPEPFRLPSEGEGQTVLERNGLTVTAFAVEHEPVMPAVGYRFDYRGRSLVVSGDTKPSENLLRFSGNVDLLAHEALAPRLMKIMEEAAEEIDAEHIRKIAVDVLDYHTSPVEAAEIAQRAKASHLLYYHLVPPLPVRPMERFFLEGVEDVYGGDVTLGRDGTLISLPSGSNEIRVDGLL